MSDLVLYSYFRSSASYRVRLALALKGLPFEYRAVHLLQNGGEQHSEAYRNLNPAREVPTLIHQGRAVAQSMAILEYLDEVFPRTKQLFPSDPYRRSLVRQFCETINCVQPMQNLRTLQFLSNELQVSEGQKQAWLDRWLGGAFQTLEKMLEKNSGTYCFGGEITAADCFLVPQVFAAKRFQVEIKDFPNLQRVVGTLELMDEFKKAHPSRQPDTPEDMRAEPKK